MSRKRRQAALVLLDGDHAAAPSRSSARVSPPGPGPISTMVAFKGARRAGDAAGEVEIEQEVLAEAFLAPRLRRG